MTTAHKYVIGNWKTNPKTQDDAQAIFGDLFDYLTHNPHNSTHCTVAIAPCFIHLPILNIQALKNPSLITLGSQDLCAYTGDVGAYTGDVSASQLADIGAKFALIGHSERRQYHGENDEILTKKIRHAFASGLSVIFCIGETKSEYEAGSTHQVLKNQLNVLEQFAVELNSTQDNLLPKLLIAYEPVWAIGTGLTPTVTEIEEVHNYISELLSTMQVYAPLLYGGSVNQNNVADIAKITGVDGVLVGGASLNIDGFSQIIRAFVD